MFEVFKYVNLKGIIDPVKSDVIVTRKTFKLNIK